MGATKIPNKYLWRETWPVWGNDGIKSAQSSLNLYVSTLTQESSLHNKYLFSGDIVNFFGKSLIIKLTYIYEQ